ncbi:BREX-1 system phosphatase PglZ type A [Butyrivibrio fibrisolvens]|uniref:BREX-1 system phosphatase PglZ type A n=1 Tax=Butyrivibrio fibrisolvens TaxID=831 RepID=UPI0003FC1F43|nr:BREX-1 system phosphatase PglZ type A [Butyrivibrio fibrisolvens]
MDSDKIIQELNQRFTAPLPEFYKRRIVFWYDEDGEFRDRLDEVTLTDAKLVALTGTNNFAVKKLLSVDDTTSNYLVYCPLAYEKPEDNWLLDIELYSEEFRADLVSIWMDELGIPSTPAMRKQVKEYRKYFNAKNRRDKIASQSKAPTVPAQLHMAVMGGLGGLKDVTPTAIMKEVLKAGLDINTNYLYREFVNYGADKAFWSMVKQGSGYDSEQHDIAMLATHMLLTATTRTMRLEYLAGLDGFISSPHQAFCFDFVSDWMHSEDQEQLTEIAKTVEEELKLPTRFMKLEVSDLVDTEIFPCLDEVILIKLMTEISDHIIDVDVIKKTVEKRRTTVGYAQFKDYYEGILQVANMQAFYKEHTTGFHSAEAKKVWKEYTSEYYVMDTYYRLFHKSYGESLKSYNSDLHDLFTHVMEKVEGLYTNWFLGQLGGNWSSVCSEELQKYGRILEIPQQTDFYKSRIANADSRVFVVISDALRYEVAASLAEQLRRETQADVKLQDVQGIFPTITKFGMAALLPHKELEVELHSEVLKVMADGVSTDASYRDKVLKNANGNSVAIKYNDLVSAKRADRSAMVKGMDVVYIYHDTIDEASHTADTMVFPACDDAIQELKNLTKIICNDFGATHILFTADHGFLYTYSPLTEDDKIDQSGFVNRVVEYGRRFAIMMKDSNPDYLQKVQFLEGKSEYDAFAPKENVRIKKLGGGLNFVHGGISLQEMVVPVIDYHFLRNQSKEYQRNQKKYDTKPVEVSLLSATHKVSNMIFSLNFYQKEPVGDNREAATYQLYFTDSSGKQISDIAKIIADKTSDNGQERTFRCSFNLKSLKYDNKEIYYLVIADADGLVVSREEFQIDIAFAVDEFDFFS